MILVLCIAAVVEIAGSTGAADSLAPDTRFGIVEAFWSPEHAQELDIGWERILFYWREIQSTGREDWNTLHVREEWLAQANARGQTVVGLLKNTAPWASVDGTEAGLPMGLYLPVDDPDNLWANFVRKVVAYYSVRNVHHWIIWNEPDISQNTFGHEFTGTLDDYARLMKVAYVTAKEVDPTATIHLAGLTWWHNESYLGDLLALIAGDPEAAKYNYYFDVVSLHIYFRSESVRTILEQVTAILNSYSLSKPVWINETNAPPNKDEEWPVDRPEFDIDNEQQSWFIWQALALGFGYGAERIAVYKLLDIHLPSGGESYGLLRPDFSKRPAYYAYQTAIDHLSGFREVSVESNRRYYSVQFRHPDSLSRVMWARTEMSATLGVPASAESARYVSALGPYGQIQPTNNVYTVTLKGARCYEECLVGGEPVILVEDLSNGNSPVTATITYRTGISQPTPMLEPPTATSTPTRTPSATPTQTSAPTQTSTPSPSSSPLPSSTPTATHRVDPLSDDSPPVTPALDNGEEQNSGVDRYRLRQILMALVPVLALIGITLIWRLVRRE